MGMREPLFEVLTLLHRCDMNITVYTCFIVYQKAFDCIKHLKLIEELIALCIGKRDTKIIASFYWNQFAEIR